MIVEFLCACVEMAVSPLVAIRHVVSACTWRAIRVFETCLNDVHHADHAAADGCHALVSIDTFQVHHGTVAGATCDKAQRDTLFVLCQVQACAFSDLTQRERNYTR